MRTCRYCKVKFNNSKWCSPESRDYWGEVSEAVHICRKCGDAEEKYYEEECKKIAFQELTPK